MHARMCTHTNTHTHTHIRTIKHHLKVESLPWVDLTQVLHSQDQDQLQYRHTCSEVEAGSSKERRSVCWTVHQCLSNEENAHYSLTAYKKSIKHFQNKRLALNFSGEASPEIMGCSHAKASRVGYSSHSR